MTRLDNVLNNSSLAESFAQQASILESMKPPEYLLNIANKVSTVMQPLVKKFAHLCSDI